MSPKDPERNRRQWEPQDGSPRLFTIRSMGMTLVCVTAMIALGYGTMSLTYRFTGEPPPIVAHILSGISGLLLAVALGSLALYIHRRQHKHTLYDTMRTRQLDQTIEAMNRIAHGDFSVLVPVNERDPFAHLAQSVNQMARELGSMENLRQDFISNVSHEIQSPLTSISGFAALLRNDALPVQQRTHYLDIIETESKRLSKLSDNLLKLSSLENNLAPLAPVSFPLHKQIENDVLLLEPQWAAKHLDLDLSLSKMHIVGDEALLSQVWINLLHNAVKFTPENGSIRIMLADEDGHAVCRIADTGPGIAPEDQMHIFERFYKVDKSRDRSLGGNGLGLSLVKKIVELHGGQVAVHSEPGRGTTLAVTLPKP